MHTFLSAAGLALLAGFGVLPRATAVPDEANRLEVVFAKDSTICGGCVASYTDSMEETGAPYGDYECSNGDIWFFTEFTPILRSANCEIMQLGCLPRGACEVTRVGYMTLLDLGPGDCPLYSVRKGETQTNPVSNDQTFVISLAVTCTAGYLTQKDCDTDFIHFLDGPSAEDGSVVMNWHIEACCNRCPN